jgi:hypothetical protein
MERLFGDIGQLIQHNPWLAVVAVFIGGATTASNPCVLAMVPLLMSVVAGGEVASIKKSLGFSALFVLGLSITFAILGLISALMGKMLGDVGAFWKYLVAGVCLVMGLHLLGLFKFNFNLPQPANVSKGGPIGAFLLGLLFGVVSTPCAVSASHLCPGSFGSDSGCWYLHGRGEKTDRVKGPAQDQSGPPENCRSHHYPCRRLFPIPTLGIDCSKTVRLEEIQEEKNERTKREKAFFSP